MQEHLPRLKAASATVTELVKRAEQAPDQPALDAALYELVEAVQELNRAYAGILAKWKSRWPPAPAPESG